MSRRCLSAGRCRHGAVVAVLLAIAGLHTAAAATATEAVEEVLLRASRLTERSALAELATAWGGERTVLVAALSADRRHLRRGAARLLVAAGASTDELLRYASACSDPTARRVLADGLRRQGDWSPADLLVLQDAALICLLWAGHPDPLPTSGEPRQRLVGWLRDPASSSEVAQLISSRGSLSDWGGELIEAMQASDDEQVVEACHRALCLLTGEQRSLAPYAGHIDLLVQDWQDLLTARGHQSEEVSAEHLAAIRRLPDAAARRLLLEAGADALPAFEQALRDSSGSERAGLKKLARLCAREVTPQLIERLDPAILAEFDHPEMQRRRACLRAVVDALPDQLDEATVRHLLTWLDDPDGSIRARVLDRLVRLSDDVDSDDWKIGHLLPTDRTIHRLRRSLRDGDSDERVGALLLIGTLKAGALVDDVVALTVVPDRPVVDTALDVLARLEVTEHLPHLLRLATDAEQPALRRVSVLELIADQGADLEAADPRRAEVLRQLIELCQDAESSVARAAYAARLATTEEGAQRFQYLRELLTDQATRDLALKYIGEKPFIPSYQAKQGTDRRDPAVLTLPLLEDPDWAGRAATVLTDAILTRKYHYRSGRLLEQLTEDQRHSIRQAALAGRNPIPALAIGLGLLTRDDLPEDYAPEPIEERRRFWHAVIQRSSDPLQGLALILALGDEAKQMKAAIGVVLQRLQNRVLTAAGNLEEIVQLGLVDVLDSEDMDAEHRRGRQLRTYRFADGSTLLLEGQRREDAEPNDSFDRDDEWRWQVKETDMPRLSSVELATLAEDLRRLPAENHLDERRDQLVQLATRQPPSQAMIDQLHYLSDIWHIFLHRHPEIRPHVVQQFNQQDEPSFWSFRELLRAGNPDLLPAVLAALAADTSKYNLEHALKWLATLPAQELIDELDGLMAIPALRDAPQLLSLFEDLDQIVLPAALSLLQAGKSLQGAEIALPENDDASRRILYAGLPGIAPATVVAQAAALRRIRNLAPQAFDQALIRVLAQPDADRQAAWLRTGLPWLAGEEELYRQAMTADQDVLWLVGQAWALATDRIDTNAFVTAVSERSPAAYHDAVLIVERYGAPAWSAVRPAVATILATAPATALDRWLRLLPPEPVFWQAVAQRSAEQPELQLRILLALDQRAQQAPGEWQAVRSLFE